MSVEEKREALDGLMSDSALNELIEAWLHHYNDGPLLAAKRQVFDDALDALIAAVRADAEADAARLRAALEKARGYLFSSPLEGSLTIYEEVCEVLGITDGR